MEKCRCHSAQGLRVVSNQMIIINLVTLRKSLVIPAIALLSGCQGIFSGVFDEPQPESATTGAGRLYIDASDWGEWHYIDFELLDAMSKNDSGFNTSSLWESYSIPTPGESGDISSPEPEQSGIYTYWYDVFGEGVKNHEYRGFMPTGKQIEPEKWTIAVHRNNVRTNGCGVYKTTYTSIDSCPTELEWLEKLEYQEDEWNETDVWAVQDKMLLGIIGCQGIYVNNTLSGWLSMEIPPMPPTFICDRHVYIVKLKDGTFAAVQLADYISSSGTKCCLTINYKYPL